MVHFCLLPKNLDLSNFSFSNMSVGLNLPSICCVHSTLKTFHFMSTGGRRLNALLERDQAFQFKHKTSYLHRFKDQNLLNHNRYEKGFKHSVYNLFYYKVKLHTHMQTHKTNMLFSNKVHHLMMPLFGNVIDANKKFCFC